MQEWTPADSLDGCSPAAPEDKTGRRSGSTTPSWSLCQKQKSTRLANRKTTLCEEILTDFNTMKIYFHLTVMGSSTLLRRKFVNSLKVCIFIYFDKNKRMHTFQIHTEI